MAAQLCTQSSSWLRRAMRQAAASIRTLLLPQTLCTVVTGSPHMSKICLLESTPFPLQTMRASVYTPVQTTMKPT